MLACGWPALLRCGAESVTNYSDRALGRWAQRISAWSRGDRRRAEWQLRTQYLEFSALFPPH